MLWQILFGGFVASLIYLPLFLFSGWGEAISWQTSLNVNSCSYLLVCARERNGDTPETVRYRINFRNKDADEDTEQKIPFVWSIRLTSWFPQSLKMLTPHIPTTDWLVIVVLFSQLLLRKLQLLVSFVANKAQTVWTHTVDGLNLLNTETRVTFSSAGSSYEL